MSEQATIYRVISNLENYDINHAKTLLLTMAKQMQDEIDSMKEKRDEAERSRILNHAAATVALDLRDEAMREPSWVEIALSSGRSRVLTMKWDELNRRYEAALAFVDIGQIVVASSGTPKVALMALDKALEEDAAQEMIDAGVV